MHSILPDEYADAVLAGIAAGVKIWRNEASGPLTNECNALPLHERNRCHGILLTPMKPFRYIFFRGYELAIKQRSPTPWLRPLVLLSALIGLNTLVVIW
ncbi:MAG TPA: hypothetical protein VFT21_01835, partial [Gemmatimonadaceae bacterium]|nr:hypothetical protein [Gemmatimonadaceae bacterium]